MRTNPNFPLTQLQGWLYDEAIVTTETPTAPTELESFVFFEDAEDFGSLYEQSLEGIFEQKMTTSKVLAVGKDFVVVDIGFKAECLIPLEEFSGEEGLELPEIGTDLEVYVESLEDDDGVTLLSKVKAEKLRVWEDVREIYENDGVVEGTIVTRVKGGLSVDIGVKAFLPGSQVDLRPVRYLDNLLGERFEFKILKYSQQRGNIVLSRRVLLEKEREDKRLDTLKVLEEGAVMKGNIKNITDYGVFVDLGGIDGLLHITDMTWGRIIHPSEMFAVGDEVDVLVLKYFPEDQKVSLGLKQKEKNPWEDVEERYPSGSKVLGKIVSITDYGAFIELEPGVEGLIHVSEMSWTRKVRHPSKILDLGQEVEAVIKELDVERKRISLSLKDAEPNPWKQAQDRYPIGSIVTGTVRNITDFGIFVGLEEGIDGLVHISDISWTQRQRRPSDVAKKGEEISVKVLSIDVGQERLSLGIKQLSGNPWKNLEEVCPINQEIEGRVVNITDFGIFVEVVEGVEGLVHISEIDQTIPKNKLSDFYKVNSTVHCRVIKIDAEERRLGLSFIGVTTAIAPELEESSSEDSDAAPVEEAEAVQENTATVEETSAE